MGFADGLRELLGGFNAVRRIDQDGFDWREKDAQAELARGQQQAEWGQSNTAFQQGQEDRGMNLASDIIAGGGSDKDAASALPAGIGEAQRKALIAAALGKGKERQSYLRGQDAYNRRLLQGDKDAAAQGREEYKAEMRSKLMQEAEAIRQNQHMSPKDKEAALLRLEAQSALFDKAEAGRNARFERGAVRLLPGQNGMIAGAYNSRPNADGSINMLPVPEGMEGMRATAAPASVQEGINRGTSALATMDSVLKLYRQSKESGENWVGPASAAEYDIRAGWGGHILGSPSSERALFASQVAGLQNEGINLRTGAQMSEHEVPRLMRELPTAADHGPVFEAKLAVSQYRFSLMDKVRRGQMSKDEAVRQMETVGPETFLQSIQGNGPSPRRAAAPSAPATPQPGSPQPTPQQGTVSFGGKQYRLRPGADPKLRSSYEEIR
jgi:hypothetical protein